MSGASNTAADATGAANRPSPPHTAQEAPATGPVERR